jgi:predicted ester cyclase
MARDKSRVLVYRLFGEAVNQQELAVLDQIISPTFCLSADDPDDQRMYGPEGMKRFLEWLFSVFPDIDYTVEDVIAEADRVVARVRARGTHQGEYLGHPGTGLPVEYMEIFVFRVIEGRIAEWWIALDRLGILQQIGVFPVV